MLESRVRRFLASPAGSLSAFVVLCLFSSYIFELQRGYFVLLIIFSVEVLVWGWSFSQESSKKSRVYIAAIIMFSTLYYVSVQNFQHSFEGVEAKIFYEGVEAMRMGQSPYQGENNSGLNLGFVPIYALCTIIGGESFPVFKDRMMIADLLSSLLTGAITGMVIICFLIRSRLGMRRNIEIIAETISVASLIYVGFRWNRVYGNFSTLLALLIVLIMIAHYFGKPVIAGILLGAAISIKPYFVSLAIGYTIFLILKKDKQALIVLISAGLVLGVTALLLQVFEGGLGVPTYAEFFETVSRKNIPGMLDNIDNLSAWAAFSAIARNLDAANSRTMVAAVSFIISSLAYGIGLIACSTDNRTRMPLEHVAYYVLLTTAIYPLLWRHYFSWLLGPAIYAIFRLNSGEENGRAVPAFIYCFFIMLFAPIAWLGTLSAPAIFAMAVFRRSHEKETSARATK